MATFTAKDADGNTITLEKPLTPGRVAAASSRPVALSTEDKASIDAITTKLTSDPATQTTLAAINTKIPASPATAGNQSTANTSLGSIDTKLSSQATAANQTTGNTSIAAVSTVLGAKTDAKSTATDGTSVSAMQVLKQISASMQAAVSDPFSEYEVVAASQTDAVLGATGAVDDYLAAIWIFPATAGCDGVTIKDGATTIYTFPGGGTTALPSLAPIPWMPGIKAKNAGFKVTTGANVAVMGIGDFT